MSNLTLRLALIGAAWLIPAVAWTQVTQSDQRPVDTDELPRIVVSGTCMGPIRYNVLAVDPPETMTEESLADAVQETLDRINQQMSTYVEDSDVSRFNRAGAEEWVPVSPETVEVVQRALKISQQSNGAFDITVGPAVNLWKFGPDKGEFQVPKASEIVAALERVGYQKLEAQSEPPALRKRHAELQIDLSAIAKGYAVDQVATTIREMGCSNYMVEVGGEVAASGHRQTGGPWRVGVERPDAVGQVPDIVAELTGQSMATSGDYRNYYRVGRKRYSHTIDPTTGRPVNHDLASACIIAQDCMTADALATAVMVMGLNKGETFLKQQGVKFFLVERNSDFGRDLTRVASPGFPFAAGRPEGVLTEAPVVSPSNESGASIWPAFLGAVVVFALVIVGMAVGAIFANKPVQGSCGGLANMTNEDGESSCAICSKPTTECVERQKAEAS